MGIVGFKSVLNNIAVLQEALHCEGVLPNYVMACWHQKKRAGCDRLQLYIHQEHSRHVTILLRCIY